MKLFKLTGHVTVTAYTNVVAENEDEAREIARDREAVIGGIHSGTSDEEQWIVDDVDGEIEHVTVEDTEEVEEDDDGDEDFA